MGTLRQRRKILVITRAQCATLFLYSVAVRYRIEKERKLGRGKGENEKSNRYQKKYKNRKTRKTAGKSAHKKPPLDKKYNGCGDKKYRYIEPIGRFAEGAVCRIEDSGNRNNADNSADKLYAPEIRSILKKERLYNRKQQKRKIKQLDMLPNRLVHARKQSREPAFTCKIVKKMKKNAQSRNEQKTADAPNR